MIEFAVVVCRVLMEIPVAEESALDLPYAPKELDVMMARDLYGQMPEVEREWMAELYNRMNAVACLQNKVHTTAAELFDDVVKQLRKGLSLQAKFQEADAGLNKPAADELLGLTHNMKEDGMHALLAVARTLGGVVAERAREVTTDQNIGVQ